MLIESKVIDFFYLANKFCNIWADTSKLRKADTTVIQEC